MAHPSVEEVLTRLRAEGRRVTTARRALLDVLLEAEGRHLTAEELGAELKRRYPEVHASTVYRNLEELEQLGVVVHVHLGHGPATYHLTGEAHNHLVCERCGKALGVPDALLAPLAEEARRRYGFVLRPQHFALLGLCKACATGDSGEPAT